MIHLPSTISLVCGCMFSGKTTELLRRLDAAPPGSVLAIKHVIDRRYRAEAVVAHGGQAWPAIAVSSAGEIPNHIRPDVRIAGIDEAHFFDEALIEVTRFLAAGGLYVILTALDLDSWGRPFPVVERLRALAHESVVIHATCARCGQLADHTQRLTPIVDHQMVGGPESYEPRCRMCWTPPPEAPA